MNQHSVTSKTNKLKSLISLTICFKSFFTLSRLLRAAKPQNTSKKMNINSRSLKNLKPGANKKDAVRVTLTLKPETVKLLKMTGNMSQAVDKFIELIKQGCVQHDGMLNPLPQSESENLQSQNVHSMSEMTALAVVDQLLQSANHGQKLNDLQSTIFLRIWAKYSYLEIAHQLNYEYDYIKQIGSSLLRTLSQILGEPVYKGNIQAVLRRYEQSQQANQNDNKIVALPCEEGSNLTEQDLVGEGDTSSILKPAYWTEVLTRKDMIERGFSAYKLDNMPFGTSVKDGYDRLWWKEAIDKGNENLRPLGSQANVVWCR